MSIVVAILLTLFGYLIKYLKQYGLIAGYNTKSKEEQEKYDIEKIGVLFGNVMFAMSAFIILGYLLSLILSNTQIEIYTVSIAMTLGLPYLLIASNSSNYKRK